ncbi:hypothetical protein ACFX1S_043464 [Malus domestica]
MSCLEKKSIWAFPNSRTCSGGGDELLKLENVSSSCPTPTNPVEKKEVVEIKESSDKAGGPGGRAGGESDHGVHTWTERERRKKMRNTFSSLHALLPHLPAKADKSTIVDESIRYIKSLEHILQTTQTQRLDKFSALPASYRELTCDTREAFLADHFHQGPQTSINLALPAALSPPPASFQTWFSPNVVMNMSGNDAQISVCSPPKLGMSTTLFYIQEKHKLDVVSVHISSDRCRCMYMIHAQVGGACDNFPEALSVEDTFKLAASEMNLWLLSR